METIITSSSSGIYHDEYDTFDDEDTDFNDEETDVDDKNTDVDDKSTDVDDKNTDFDDEDTGVDDKNTDFDDKDTDVDAGMSSLIVLPQLRLRKRQYIGEGPNLKGIEENAHKSIKALYNRIFAYMQ